MSKTSPEIRQLLRELPPGYTTRPSGNSGHLVLVEPGGEPVRVEGRPLQIPSSPSDWRASRNLRSQLKRAGLFDKAPSPGLGSSETPGRALTPGDGQDQERVGYSAVTGSAATTRPSPADGGCTPGEGVGGLPTRDRD